MNPKAIEMAIEVGKKKAEESNKEDMDTENNNFLKPRELPLLGSKENNHLDSQKEIEELRRPIETMDATMDDETMDMDICCIELENTQRLLEEFNLQQMNGKEVADILVKHSGYLTVNPEQLLTLCAHVPQSDWRDAIFQDASGYNALEEFDAMDPLLPLPQSLERFLLPYWDGKPIAVVIDHDTLCATYNAHPSPGTIYHAEMPRRRGNSIDRAVATRLETLIRSCSPKAPKVPYGRSEPIAFVAYAGPHDLYSIASDTLVENYNVSGTNFEFKFTLKIMASYLHDGKFLGANGWEDYEMADTMDLLPTELLVLCVDIFAHNPTNPLNNHQAHIMPVDMDDLYRQIVAQSNFEQLRDSIRADFPAQGPHPEQTISRFLQHPDLQQIATVDLDHLSQLVSQNPITIAQMGLGMIKSSKHIIRPMPPMNVSLYRPNNEYMTAEDNKHDDDRTFGCLHITEHQMYDEATFGDSTQARKEIVDAWEYLHEWDRPLDAQGHLYRRSITQLGCPWGDESVTLESILETVLIW
jgi:hypothetical protein